MKLRRHQVLQIVQATSLPGMSVRGLVDPYMYLIWASGNLWMDWLPHTIRMIAAYIPLLGVMPILGSLHPCRTMAEWLSIWFRENTNTRSFFNQRLAPPVSYQDSEASEFITMRYPISTCFASFPAIFIQAGASVRLGTDVKRVRSVSSRCQTVLVHIPDNAILQHPFG